MTDHIHDEKSPCIFDELRDHPTLLKSVIGDGELTPCRYGAQDEEQGRFNSNRPSSELFTIRDNGIPVCREHHALLKNAFFPNPQGSGSMDIVRSLVGRGNKNESRRMDYEMDKELEGLQGSEDATIKKFRNRKLKAKDKLREENDRISGDES